MDKRYTVPTIIAAVLLVAIAVVLSIWSDLQSPVQAAIISGFITALTALLGAGLLIWQMGRQAQNAIDANRTTEAIKLKKDVYLDLIKACSVASNAQSEMTSYIQQFEFAITGAQTSQKLGYPVTVPSARAMKLSEIFFAASSKATELVMLQERWEIIDPRSAIFRKAFGHAFHELHAAWGKYFDMAIREMPHVLQNGSLLPWQVPNDAKSMFIRSLGDDMRHAYHLYGCYIIDLQNEMQNALLGELFEPNRIPLRDPPDPVFRTVRLDQVSELEAFFAATPMGMERTKIEAEARERFTVTS